MAHSQKKSDGDLSQEVDVWMIRENLKLSYEERIHQNQTTIDFVKGLKEEIQKYGATKPREATANFDS